MGFFHRNTCNQMFFCHTDVEPAVLRQAKLGSPASSIHAIENSTLKVVGARKNGRTGGRHAKGEGTPAWKAHENRFNSHSGSADISNWSRGSGGKE